MKKTVAIVLAVVVDFHTYGARILCRDFRGVSLSLRKGSAANHAVHTVCRRGYRGQNR